jgi:hypothetical protein
VRIVKMAPTVEIPPPPAPPGQEGPR